MFLDLHGREPDAALDLQDRLRAQGILVSMLYGRLRMVTHRDVDEAGVLQAVEAVRRHLGAAARVASPAGR